MILLLGIVIFLILFGIYDVIRNVNKNILKQTEEIKDLRHELRQLKRD